MFTFPNILDANLDKFLQKSVDSILTNVDSTFASEFNLNLVTNVVIELAKECYELYNNFAFEFHLLTGEDNEWIKYTNNIQILSYYSALIESYVEFVPTFCEDFPKMLILNSFSGNTLKCCYYLTQPMPNMQQQCLLLDEHLDKPVVNRDEWYLISANWFKSWIKHTRSSSVTPLESPGPIDNRRLLHGLTLKPNLTQIIDYQPIPGEKWEELLSWYGLSVNSIAIRRIAVRKTTLLFPHSIIELYPIHVTCSVIGRKGSELIRIGRTERVGDLLEKIKLALKIESCSRDPVCIYMYKCTYKGVELLTDLTIELEHAKFLDGQKVCVEFKCN